jgi:hypothetical protein
VERTMEPKGRFLPGLSAGVLDRKWKIFCPASTGQRGDGCASVARAMPRLPW